MKTSSSELQRKAASVQLLSVKALHNIVLSQGGKTINPHQQLWNKRKQAVPAAFDTSSSAPAQLEASLLLSNKQHHYTLEALYQSTPVFSGKVKAAGPVRLNLVAGADLFPQLQQASLEWKLTGEEETISLGTTDVALFFVNMQEVPTSLYKKGIPVETLQSLSAILPLSASAAAKETSVMAGDGVAAAFVAASTIIQNVFNYVPPRYDVWNGAPHFVTINGWNNITLHYNAYLAAHANALSTLNCYDAAAVLQYSLKYYGYATKYCYMQPFGYLKQTNLIGRGQCNNPFFASSGTPQLIAQTNTKRTAFGNHAFIYLTSNGAIADACAGPHIGNEFPQTYVNNAVDSIFPNPPKVAKGTAANIGYYNGIVSVSFMSSLHEMATLPHTESFMAKTSFNHKAAAAFTHQAVAGKWPSPAECPALEKGWKVYYEEIVPGTEEVLKMWMLKKGRHSMMIKLYVVSGDNKLAYNRFVSLGSLSQSVDSAYKSGPKSLGHFSAVSAQKGHNRCFWVYHNTVLDIVTSDDDADIRGISKWMYKWATQNLTADLQAHLPAADVQHSGLQPKVGERIYVSLPSEENVQLDFEHAEEGLRLITDESKNLVFDTLKPFKHDLKVLVIDRDTLLVNTTTLKVEAGE